MGQKYFYGTMVNLNGVLFMGNSQQIEYWNGQAGHNWATQAEHLDGMLFEFCEWLIAQTADGGRGDSFLDIGCGAGAVSLGIAKTSVKPDKISGIDISEPLLAVARQRAESARLPVRYVRADASTHRLETPVDTMVSRFGVMFFDDPISAFGNLKQSAKVDGRLVFTCWQSIKKNAWASAPMRAAIPLLNEPLPPPDPIAPGPFAFADKDRLNGILSESGWSDIQIRAFDTRLRLPGNNLAETAVFLMTLGPLARVLNEQGLEEAPVKAALIELLSEHQVAGEEVWMDAASWLVSCRAG